MSLDVATTLLQKRRWPIPDLWFALKGPGAWLDFLPSESSLHRWRPVSTLVYSIIRI